MDTRYCDESRLVDEDAYLRNFIQAVEHKNKNYVEFVVPIIKKQQLKASTDVNESGHYISIATEDSSRYGTMLSHGLILAAYNNSYDIAVYLVKEGVSIDARNLVGDTALIKACERGNLKIVELLIKSGADVNLLNYSGNSALHVACLGMGCVEVVDLLLSYNQVEIDLATRKRGRTALHNAAEYDSQGKKVKKLLVKNATVNIVDDDGLTPLHLAAQRGLINNVILLIHFGAYVNTRSQKLSRTPLHLAMEEKHQEVALYLMKCGSDAGCLDKFGLKPVDLLRRKWKSSDKDDVNSMENFLNVELERIYNSERSLMQQVFDVLCEKIPEDRWIPLFSELFGSSEVLDNELRRIACRNDVACLSASIFHLLECWTISNAETGGFWVLMRALRSHGMDTVAEEMIGSFWPEDIKWQDTL